MDDWGKDGPYFGPLENVGGTYINGITLGFEDNNLYISKGAITYQGKEYRNPIFIYDDMIYYDGMFYGEWTVFYYEGN